MNLPNKIQTIRSLSEFILKEKGSQFISHAFPVPSENEAIEKLNDVKKKYYNASHHCYAYKFADGKSKYSDDGEPSGTAGIRILNAINHFDLLDLTVIVTRYFGGTKLGVGLLGKTYYESAFHSLEEAERISKTLFRRIQLIYPFELSNSIHNYLSKYSAKIEGTSFEKLPSIQALLPFEKYDFFIKEIDSIFGAKVKINDTENFLYL